MEMEFGNNDANCLLLSVKYISDSVLGVLPNME